MFIPQRPKDSKQRVTNIVMTPEEVEEVWTALANSIHKNPTAEKLRRLLWREMQRRPEPILKGRIKTLKEIDSRRSIVRFESDSDNAA